MKETIVKQARRFCDEQKERLTKPREQVLKIIASSSKPIGAYEVLRKLGKVMDEPKPPTVYRAIDFWLQNGFIHCIESLNAYVTCKAGHRHQGSQFMICDDCGVVIETHLCQLPTTLKSRANQSDFTPKSWSVEVHGLCSECH